MSFCPNLARTAAIEVHFSLNFAVVFDFIYFRFRPTTDSFSGFCLSLGYRIPCGLFTPGSFYPVVFANFLVLKDLAKLRDFHFSRIFPRLLTYEGWH